MSVFSFPDPGASPDEIIAEMDRVEQYLRTARDPNEAGDNGKTLLLLALTLHAAGKSESLVTDLLERGADPNLPSPWLNFTMLLTVSSSLNLVKKFINRGLRLNDLHEASTAKGGMTNGPSTVLDHLYGIREYISPKRKKLDALAKKYAGGLGKRRHFIDETIANLEACGAKRAAELQ